MALAVSGLMLQAFALDALLSHPSLQHQMQVHPHC